MINGGEEKRSWYFDDSAIAESERSCQGKRVVEDGELKEGDERNNNESNQKYNQKYILKDPKQPTLLTFSYEIIHPSNNKSAPTPSVSKTSA